MWCGAYLLCSQCWAVLPGSLFVQQARGRVRINMVLIVCCLMWLKWCTHISVDVLPSLSTVEHTHTHVHTLTGYRYLSVRPKIHMEIVGKSI